MNPANISESMIKSVLVRARYRDSKIDELKRLKAELTFCHICKNVITTEWKTCERCDEKVCLNCVIQDGTGFWQVLCTKCEQKPCVNCHTKQSCNNLLACLNCSDYVCKRCVYEGGDYDYCSEKCYNRYNERRSIK